MRCATDDNLWCGFELVVGKRAANSHFLSLIPPILNYGSMLCHLTLGRDINALVFLGLIFGSAFVQFLPQFV